MSRTRFRAEIGSRVGERIALLAAIGSTGRTFGRGLMPRTRAGQAVATGLTGSVNYGLAITGQSAVWAGASVVGAALIPEGSTGEDVMRTYRSRVRLVAYGTYLTGALVAAPLQRIVAQRHEETVRRGLARAVAQRATAISALGLLGTAVLDAGYSLSDALALEPNRRRTLGTALVLVAGTAVATASVRAEKVRRASLTGERVPALDAASIAAGAATALGLTVLGRAETAAARAVGGALDPVVPPALGTAVGHGAMLGALAMVVWQGAEHLYRNVERAGSAVESLHADPPANLHVSGGPASSLPWTAMSWEGRRFAALPLSQAEIATVMGQARAEPVRVFVPLSAAGTAQERARLAVAEMDALGGFDRGTIVLCSPTGTGYVNYVMAEAVEYLTRGDCAIVATQYSLRPSFLSLDRVSVGRQNARALFGAVHERVAAMASHRRPRVVQFGEGLGAHTGQDVMMHRGAGAFAELGIARALFIGTPDGSEWAQEWRADPDGTDPGGIVVEVDSFEQFEALPAARRGAARIILVSHDEDPITKFGPELLLRQPPWLDPDPARRPAGIPPEMQWRPVATFFMTVADVMNSMTVVPGQFGSEGHDYREDLARFVSVGYDLPCSPDELARIEAALRSRELYIAESRLLADHIGTARARAASAMARWGLDPGLSDRLLEELFVLSGPPRSERAVADDADPRPGASAPSRRDAAPQDAAPQDADPRDTDPQDAAP